MRWAPGFPSVTGNQVTLKYLQPPLLHQELLRGPDGDRKKYQEDTLGPFPLMRGQEALKLTSCIVRKIAATL